MIIEHFRALANQISLKTLIFKSVFAS